MTSHASRVTRHLRTAASGVGRTICTAAAVIVAIPAVAATTAQIEPRILAQEGLAIALASNVLQSQLQVLAATTSGSSGCSRLTGGGSVQLISAQTSGSVTNSEVYVYFDAACKSPDIEAAAAVTTLSNGYSITETANYLGLKGQPLGSLTLSESATGSSSVVLIGTGKFTPANGAKAVDLGLTCTIPGNGKTINCEGGIAQDFPKLKASLASVTPLTLTAGKANSISFAGSSSTMETGALGALSIITPTGSTLGIGGSGSNYGSAATAGFASKFSLFPPTPTYWAITDSAHDAKFSLSVVSNTTRNSTATVTTISTGATLATLAVDKSGTGKIAYSDGSKATITSWLLAD